MLSPSLGLALSVSLLLPAPQELLQEEEGSLRVLVHGSSPLTERLIRRGFDARKVPPLGRGRAAAEVILEAQELPRLQAFAGKASVVVLERSRPYVDILAQQQKAAGPEGPDARYKTPQEIVTELGKLEQSYPTLARRIDLNARYKVALTHNSKRIYALKISDNVARDEDEPAILLVANHHARELNTIEVALYTAAQLLSGHASDPKLKKLVDENEIWILPTMNPDGLDYVWTTNNMWRKNRRNNGGGSYGVDQNRNYPYYWSRCGSSTFPGSAVYHGPSAGSEPETKVMLALGQAEVFERMLDVHSYSRDVRYGYNRLTGPRLPVAVKSFLDKIQTEVATAMLYKVNSSCCCGGDQAWHLAENGSLAYLTEVGLSFQPTWISTQAELKQVWPGVRHLFERAVPLRGHVRSLLGSKPLAAEIEILGQPLLDGQKRRSSPRHGRYAVWVGPGIYDVVYKAPGHQSHMQRVSLKDGQTLTLDVLLIPSMRPTVLSHRGTPKLGGTAWLDLSSPDDPGRAYFVAVAFGNVPRIQVGPRQIPLTMDSLLLSMLFMPGIFQNATGTLSSTGSATMMFSLPSIPALAGLRLYFAGMTFAMGYPDGVKGISNGLQLTLLP